MGIFGALIRLLNGILRLFKQRKQEKPIDIYQLTVDGINLTADKNAVNRKKRLLDIAKIVFDEKRYSEITKVNEYESGLTWSSHQRKLFRTSDLSIEKMWHYISQIDSDVMRMHGIADLIRYSLDKDDVENAKKYTEKLHGLDISMYNDMRTLGNRILLKYYSEKGDIEKFMTYLKISESTKERNEIARLKSELIENISTKESIDNAINLCNRKEFGIKFLYTAIFPYTKKINFSEMQEIIDSDNLSSIDESDKLSLLVETYANWISKSNFNDKVFDKLFNQISKIDSKIKNGDQRLIDWLFMRLGTNLNDIDYVIKCRMAIKNNRLKEELKLVENKLKNVP